MDTHAKTKKEREKRREEEEEKRKPMLLGWTVRRKKERTNERTKERKKERKRDRETEREREREREKKNFMLRGVPSSSMNSIVAERRLGPIQMHACLSLHACVRSVVG